MQILNVYRSEPDDTVKKLVEIINYPRVLFELINQRSFIIVISVPMLAGVFLCRRQAVH